MYFSKDLYGCWREETTSANSSPRKARTAMRFIVIGDMHKDYPNTSSTDVAGVDKRTGPPTKPVAFIDRFNLLLNHLRKEKEEYGLDFIVFNGDLIHSTYVHKVPPLREIKDAITSRLHVPCYAAYGNHDRATDEQWQRVFGHTRHYFFSCGNYGFIILNTSDTDGSRDICEGEDFLAHALNTLRDQTGVFVFSHIPRYSGIRAEKQYDSPQCQAILDLLKQHHNIVAVIHSHFHEEDRMLRKQGVNYWFTGHSAHYGLNYYGCRVIDIDSCDRVDTQIYDVTNGCYREDDGPVDRDK